MTGREFKRLVGTQIPDEAVVEMAIQVMDLKTDKEETIRYEIKDIKEAPCNIWLIEASKEHNA